MAGDIVHVEFPAEDVDRAQNFWSGLFGWEFGESQMPELDYRMARTGENSGVAVWNSDKGTGHPSYYFEVDDMEAARAKVVGARRLGRGQDPGAGHGLVHRVQRLRRKYLQPLANGFGGRVGKR